MNSLDATPPGAPSAGPEAEVPSREPPRRRVQLRHQSRLYYAEAAALPALTVALILFFTLLPSTADIFPTAGNFRVTMGAQAALVVIAMGALIPLICGEYDFSVGATAGLA